MALFVPARPVRRSRRSRRRLRDLIVGVSVGLVIADDRDNGVNFTENQLAVGFGAQRLVRLVLLLILAALTRAPAATAGAAGTGTPASRRTRGGIGPLGPRGRGKFLTCGRNRHTGVSRETWPDAGSSASASGMRRGRPGHSVRALGAQAGQPFWRTAWSFA
jgi:hypothetical protein